MRSDVTGELIYKDHVSSAISAILTADYRSDGHTVTLTLILTPTLTPTLTLTLTLNPNPDPNPNQELIVCSDDGEVKAYLPAGEELTSMGGGMNDGAVEEDTLRELHQRKQEPNPNPDPNPNPNHDPNPNPEPRP